MTLSQAMILSGTFVVAPFLLLLGLVRALALFARGRPAPERDVEKIVDLVRDRLIDAEAGANEYGRLHGARVGRNVLWSTDGAFLALGTYATEPEAQAALDALAGVDPPKTETWWRR